MKKKYLIPFILVISLSAKCQNIENFYRLFPVGQPNTTVYDSGVYCKLLRSFKLQDTIPAFIYNNIALRQLLVNKQRPQILFKERKIPVRDIGRFSGGPHAEEILEAQKPQRRETLYQKGLYPLGIDRNRNYVNVFILRRDGGYGFIELLSYDLTGNLVSGIFLVEGELGFPLKMRQPKVTSTLSADGTITQIIETIDTTITRIVRQRTDGFFEIISQSN